MSCGGGHYLNWTRINSGDENAATIRVITWAIIKVSPGALGQIWHSPGDQGGRPEQKYFPSDPRLEWPAEGPLLKAACFRKFQIECPDR